MQQLENSSLHPLRLVKSRKPFSRKASPRLIAFVTLAIILFGILTLWFAHSHSTTDSPIANSGIPSWIAVPQKGQTYSLIQYCTVPVNVPGKGTVLGMAITFAAGTETHGIMGAFSVPNSGLRLSHGKSLKLNGVRILAVDKEGRPTLVLYNPAHTAPDHLYPTRHIVM